MRTGPGASVSFEDFVRARSAALFRTALLLTGQDRAEAEDLLQCALERAYRHWGRVCRSGEPERYVRRILANASTDRWRRLGRRPERSHSEAGDQNGTGWDVQHGTHDLRHQAITEMAEAGRTPR